MKHIYQLNQGVRDRVGQGAEKQHEAKPVGAHRLEIANINRFNIYDLILSIVGGMSMTAEEEGIHFQVGMKPIGRHADQRKYKQFIK